MSHAVLEDRVGKVEQEIGRQGQELARQGERMGRLETDVSKINDGVSRLLEREARAPKGLTMTTIAATCGGLVSIAVVVWWLISSSPAVQDITRRLDKLDDPQVGRVPAVERKLERLEAWTPTVRAGRP